MLEILWPELATAEVEDERLDRRRRRYRPNAPLQRLGCWIRPLLVAGYHIVIDRIKRVGVVIDVVTVAPRDDGSLIDLDTAEIYRDMAARRSHAASISATDRAIIELGLADLRVDERLDGRAIRQHVLERVNISAVVDHV
eukprot:7389773-Prymnesium_polylepis.1